MPTSETAPTSYLAAVRKVVLPNSKLETFRDQLKVDARETIGLRGANTVMVPALLDLQLQPDYEPAYENVDKLWADVFSLRSLRLVLFMRRATASTEVNRLLFSAHARLTNSEFYTGRSRRTMTGRRQPRPVSNMLPEELTAIQTNEGFSDGNLPVTSSNVVRTAPFGSPEQRYALQIDGPAPYSNVLLLQQAAIDDESGQIQATKGLLGDGRFDTDADPLTLTIARVPGGRSSKTERFEEVINLHESLHFELGPVEWRLNLATPE